MALAHLEYFDADAEAAHFRIDIGSNRYYRVAVGDGGTVSRHGVRLLDRPSYVSELAGPVDESAEGRTEVAVPAQLLRDRRAAVQLMSFRTARREGPAVSAVVRVPYAGEAIEMSADPTHRPVTGPHRTEARQAFGTVRKVAAVRRRLRVRRPIAQAQFLAGLVSLLPQMLPAVGGLLGNLFGRTDGARAPAAATPEAQLMAFLRQLLASVPQTAGNAPPAAPPAVRAAAPDAASRVAATPATAAPLSLEGYAEAQVAPALLAVLPALMPLLQQVLNPQTIQAVLQTADPTRIIGAVSDSVQQVGRLGLESQRQELDHLRSLNPGVDDENLHRLLASLSLNLGRGAAGPSYRRVRSARLHFADVSTVMLDGRERVVYLRGKPLSFPLAVESRRPIPPGQVQVVIKQAQTLAEVARSRTRTPQVPEGRLPVAVSLTAEELSALKPGEEYLVTATLLWRSRTGERVGTSVSQLVTLVGEYSFDRVEEEHRLVPLNDVDRFRDYWHKVYEDSFDDSHNRLELQCDYHYVLEPGRTENAWIGTESRLSAAGLRRVSGTVRAGLEMSPNELNQLIPAISPGRMLGEAELGALLTPAFCERLSLAARTQARFGGRPGTVVALWVFPEVKLQPLLLQRAEKVNENGLVVSLAPHRVSFPVPALAHFVGVSSQ